MKSFYVDHADAFVRYFDIPALPEFADAPVRVFLCGLSTPSTAGLLDLAMHPKVRGHRSLLIDYIGSGFSDKSDKFDQQMPSHADYVAQILDHESVSNCEIIGHSMGGTVAIYLGLQRPDLVRQIVCAEGNLMAGGGPGTRRIASFSEAQWLYEVYTSDMMHLRQKAREGDAIAQMVSGAWEASDPYGIYHQSRSLVNLPDDFFEQICNLPMPFTFIYGDQNLPENNNGEIWPDSPEPDTLTSRGLHIEVIPNSGHMMMVDNPDGFAEAIARGLNHENLN